MELSDELAQDSYQWGDGSSAPSKSLLEVIKGRDIPQ
tara:strand:- start:22399 stop:22509 length:111 start_codon:yes stop_codon:yes gene_type:complete